MLGSVLVTFGLIFGTLFGVKWCVMRRWKRRWIVASVATVFAAAAGQQILRVSLPLSGLPGLRMTR